jgi:hypothetical protein
MSLQPPSDAEIKMNSRQVKELLSAAPHLLAALVYSPGMVEVNIVSVVCDRHGYFANEDVQWHRIALHHSSTISNTK